MRALLFTPFAHMFMQSNADVYASFGVNSAVLSSDNIEEHRQTMLERNVDVRDGDDSIVLSDEPDTQVTDFVAMEAAEKTIVTINTDPNAPAIELDNEGVDGAGDEGAPEGDFPVLGEPDKELVDAQRLITEHAQGFQSMRDTAIKNGMSEEVAAKVESEYAAQGELSEESLAALEAAGFNRAFVNSYIQGQEAMAQNYVNGVIAFAGGQAQFERIVNHMQGQDPASVQALYSAIEAQDVNLVKTLINMGTRSVTKKFGKTPQRNVAAKAPASAPSADRSKVEGYAAQSEMIKAMGDARYGRDAKYTEAVRARVIASNF